MCHEPAAFTCALINSQPMGFYAPSQLIADARRHGVEVRPTDVLHSDWYSTLERAHGGGPAIRLGLHLVKGLWKDEALDMIERRKRNNKAEFFMAKVRHRYNGWWRQALEVDRWTSTSSAMESVRRGKATPVTD